MVHRYEFEFSVMYNDKITDAQSTIISASSLEEAHKKLELEVKRRLGKCQLKVDITSLLVSENNRYTIE
ncbi:hypothetical protein LW858_30620 (plasmid) [Bacillus cereus]|uniref:hypothetical protein n=1 Tax=Bacillus TaxID=1386 RepID=UPI001F1C7A65|nr:hypothetical protein [Bacillus cereus]UIJ69565.1 hypothetical protein LW858_30620 [Bacillus cereus]